MVQYPLPSASSSSQAKGPTDGEYKFLPSFCKLRQAYGEDYASRRKILEKQTIRVAKNSSQVNLQSLENHLESKNCKKIQEALFQWSVVLSEKERANQAREERLNSLQQTLEEQAFELSTQNLEQHTSEHPLLSSEAALQGQESQVDEVATMTSPSDLENNEIVYATPRRSNSHVGQPWRSRSNTF
jgi:hypothetical protein